MNDHAGFSATGSTWIGHRRGTGGYLLMQLAVFLSGTATFAQLYAPQAVLPQISATFSVSTASSAIMVSAGTIGLALTVVPWSLIADRIGRKRTMSFAIIAATALAFITLAMPTFELAVVARFFEGCALGGVPGIAMAYLNEEVHRRDVPAAVGTYIAGNTMGGLGGRIVAGPLTELTGSWQFGVLTVAILSSVAAALFVWLAPTPHGFTPLGKDTSLSKSVQLTLSNAWRHLHDPILLTLYLQPFLFMGGFVAIYNYLAFHLSEPPFSLPIWLTSLVFLAYIAGAATSPFAGRLADKYGRKLVMLVSSAIALVGLLLMLVPSVPAIVVGLVVFTGSFFGAHTNTSSWAAAWPRTGRAQSTALYNLSYYIGSSTIGFLAGFVFQHWHWPALVLSVVFLFLIGMFAALLVLPRKRPQ